MKKEIIVVPTASLVGLTTLFTVVLSSPISFADTSATTTTTVTVPPACSLTASNTSPHTTTILPGHEDTEIGSTTMTVECNDGSGSKIYAIGYSNDTFGNTNMIDTSTNSTIPTGTGTSSSNWSMKLSVPTGNTAPTIRSDATYNFTNYEVVPNDYALVATFSSSADGTNNSTFNTTYRAYVGASQAPGTYIGKVKYTLVHPSNASAPSAYTITYADASNEATGLPASQTGEVTSTANVTLSSTEPTREDYTFNGWCTVNNSADTSACSGTTYDAGDTYTITNTGVATNITLYAIWESDRLYMQDMTLSDCQVNVGTGGNAANVGDNITVYDKRSSNYASGDEGDYTVRYINGACWMTQNLRIQGTVSATDSNFSSGSINVSQYDLKTNGSSECDSSNGYNNPCSRVPDSTDMSAIGSGVTAKEVGAWYNYYAASAGTISTNSNSTLASSNICPSGWHLPTGPADSTSSEYYILSQSTYYGWINSNDYITAFGAVKGGYYDSGSLNYAGYGYLWSATAHDATYREHLYYDSSNGKIYGSGHSRRSNGNTVRCVLNE